MANFGKLLNRRKSAGTAIEDAQNSQPESPDEHTPPPSDQSSQSTGFRVMSQAEASSAKRASAEKIKEKPKFAGRFSGGKPFSSPAQKSNQRQSSFDDDSGASNRQSGASSSSTGYSAQMPGYRESWAQKPLPGQPAATRDHWAAPAPIHQMPRYYRPDRAEEDCLGQPAVARQTWTTKSNSGPMMYSSPEQESDNMFAHVPPPDHLRKNSGHTFSFGGAKKARTFFSSSNRPSDSDGKTGETTQQTDATPGNRQRAMTTSSYASTAVPPRVEAELPLGSSDFSSSFDDMFSGIGKQSPPPALPPVPAPPTGRALLANRRTFQPDPIQVNTAMSPVEPPMRSWESRDSGDRLIAASPSEYDSPPPVPAHKTALPQQSAVAKGGYTIPKGRRQSTNSFDDSYEDRDARLVRQSVAARKSIMSASPEPNLNSTASSSAQQTPSSSRSISNSTTPKALSRVPLDASDDEDDDNMFDFTKKSDVKKPLVPRTKVEGPFLDASTVASANAARKFTEAAAPRKVLTQAQFKKQQQLQAQQPPEEDSEEEEDFEDHDEAEAEHIKKQQEIRRKQEAQMAMHREIMRKSTAPGELSSNRASTMTGVPSSGYPPEMFINRPAEDDDDDIPLAILQQHGFPSRTRPPSKPTDAAPSYYRQSSLGVPDRPASAGSVGQRNRMSTANLPAFARNLPADPYFGAGLVRPSNRESLGFGANPMGSSSVYGGPAGTPDAPVGGLVGVIAKEEEAKAIRRSKGSSTYGFGSTYGHAQAQQPTPFFNAPQQPGMMPSAMRMQNPMMQPMMQQMMMMQPNGTFVNAPLPAMGMPPGMDMSVLAKEIANQMMQMQVNGNQMQQPTPQMPFINAPAPTNPSAYHPHMGAPMQQYNQHQQQRPTNSRMSTAPSLTFTPPAGPPPFSTRASSQYGMPAPTPGYSHSIAPSERSNIGMSSRYRPVVTHHDGVSSESSQTLQAVPGPADGAQKRATVKSILKPAEKKESEEGGEWVKLSNRRSKWLGGGKKKEDASFKELYGGLGGVEEE